MCPQRMYYMIKCWIIVYFCLEVSLLLILLLLLGSLLHKSAYDIPISQNGIYLQNRFFIAPYFLSKAFRALSMYIWKVSNTSMHSNKCKQYFELGPQNVLPHFLSYVQEIGTYVFMKVGFRKTRFRFCSCL